MTAGERNALTDVPGIRVGHATRTSDGSLTGTTVVLVPPGAVTSVDVRGGGPSTRDTAALDPRAPARRIGAIVLTGGSAYGHATTAGVLDWLAEHRPDADPVVPTAALFDLGRGGDFHAYPGPDAGAEAVLAAAASDEHAPLAQGNVGAGTGAVTAEMKGGIGTASQVLPNGTVVAALVALNSHHPAVDPDSGLPYGHTTGVSTRLKNGTATPWYEFPLTQPDTAERTAAHTLLEATVRGRAFRNPLNTVLGVVATNAALTPAEAYRLAGRAHDGLAVSVRPAHGVADGDTVFAVATGETAGGPEVITAAATVVARAVVHAVLAARSVVTGWGHIAAYHELYPGTVPAAEQAYSG